jgi:hypothetical protein
MNLVTRVCRIGFTLALAGALGACGDGPPSPLAPSTAPPPGTGVAAPALLRVEIAGPDVVPPGGTAQFTAVAHFSDGSTRDVTHAPEWSWRSCPAAVLTISDDGVATGIAPGEAAISKTSGWMSPGCPSHVSKDVMVLPHGSFRLSGTVRDGGAPVPGAEITVTGVHGTPLSTVSARDGTYRVYGVSGRVELLATTGGYQPASLHVDIGGHETVDIELTPAGAPDPVTGSYRLTIIAQDGCWARPPDRTYTATLDQQDRQLLGTLDGAEFAIESGRPLNRFSGVVRPERLRLLFAAGDVVEVISRDPLRHLAIAGEAVVDRVAADRYEGTLSGTLQYPFVDATPTPYSCSGRHRLVLTR